MRNKLIANNEFFLIFNKNLKIYCSINRGIYKESKQHLFKEFYDTIIMKYINKGS
jgi:hypothetical protein